MKAGLSGTTLLLALVAAALAGFACIGGEFDASLVQLADAVSVPGAVTAGQEAAGAPEASFDGGGPTSLTASFTSQEGQDRTPSPAGPAPAEGPPVGEASTSRAEPTPTASPAEPSGAVAPGPGGDKDGAAPPDPAPAPSLPPPPDPAILSALQDVSKLKELFNEDQGVPRLLLLLSPT